MGIRGLHHHLFALSLLCSVGLVIGLSSTALAAPKDDQLQGSVVHPPAGRFHARSNAGSNTGSKLLYLNRCLGGCEIQPGFEDSRTNHSSILESARTLSEFEHSDADWQFVLQCVRELYAPFEVVVTDVDPGQVEHSEAMVAGTAVEGGFLGAGGVAPFTCGFIDNAITFTFANNYENMRTICNVVGQESAHGFGLDHELECADPLTYLRGCPLKSFQDSFALCGESLARPCQCGGNTQNSFRYLEELFGSGVAPTIDITSPADQSQVEVGFEVRAKATDDVATTRAELWIDGIMVSQVDEAPFEFRAPTTLAPGSHEIEVRVFDDREVYGTEEIAVTQEACSDRNQCDFSYLCLGGQCTLGPGNAGGLGENCSESDDCQSQVCARDRNLPTVCAAPCDLDPLSCPHGYQCVISSDGPRVCMSDVPRHQGGFCSAGGHGTPAALALLLLVLWYMRKHGEARNRRPEVRPHRSGS